MPESTTQARRVAQGKHAAAVRWRKPNQCETARDLAAAQLADYIAKVVDAAPPLTAEQRDRLALLLHPGGGNDAASLLSRSDTAPAPDSPAGNQDSGAPPPGRQVQEVPTPAANPEGGSNLPRKRRDGATVGGAA